MDPTTDVDCLRNYVEVCPRGPKYVTQFQYKNPSRHPPPPIRPIRHFFYLFATFPLPSGLFYRLARIHKIARKQNHWIMDSPYLGHKSHYDCLFSLYVYIFIWLLKLISAYFKKYSILWNSAFTVQADL